MSVAVVGFNMSQGATGHDLYGISIVSSHPEKVQIKLVQSDIVLKLQNTRARNNGRLTANTFWKEQ